MKENMEKQDEGTGLSPATMNSYKKKAAQSNYLAHQRYARIASTSGLSKKYKDSKEAEQKKIFDKRSKGLDMAAKKTGTHAYQKEDAQDPNHHKSEFERHAKKQLGHNSMANSEEAANNDKVMTHHEDKEEHHFAKAQHHANEYHKLTKKKLTMPDRAHEHEDHGYSNVKHGKSHGMSDDSHYVKEAFQLAPLVPYLATAAATASRISPQTYAQLPSMAMNKAKEVGKAAKTTYKKFKKFVSGKKTNEEIVQEGPKDAQGKSIFVKKIAKSAGTSYEKAGAIAAAAGRKRMGKAKFDAKAAAGRRAANEEAMTTADAGIPQDTKNMGPSRLPMHILRRKLGIPVNVTDRRRKKSNPPTIRKKFRSKM